MFVGSEICQCRQKDMSLTSWPWPSPLNASADYNTVSYCLLAMTANYMNVFRGSIDREHDGANYLAKTLRLVSRNLSSETVPDDATLAVIVSLTMQANHSGNVRSGAIHLSGLQRILSLRPGGAHGLMVPPFRTLMQKMCRADVEHAILEGSATRFGQERLIDHDGVFSVPEVPRLPIPAGPLANLNPVLREITMDALVLSKCPGAVKLDPCRYQDMLISLSQRLLDFRPIGGVDGPSGGLNDAWQLGLLTFVTTVHYPVGGVRLATYDLLLDRLRRRLNDVDLVMVPGLAAVRMWMLVMYSISMLAAGEDRRWVVPQIRKLADELGLALWEDARTCLATFPWVAVAHDEPGRDLWTLVQVKEEVRYLGLGL
jgi:hypothetical protein